MASNRYEVRDNKQKVHDDQVERIRDLEAENIRLQDEVTVLTLDKLILNEIVETNKGAGIGS